MGNKKYYWLKLTDDFFGMKEIKKLRRIAGGDTYTIIYLKLQLLSLKTEGKLYFDGIEDTLIEELSLILDENLDNIKVTFLFLEKHGLIEQIQNDEFLLPKVLLSFGSETATAERVRKHREHKKTLLCNNDVTKCNIEKRREDVEKRKVDVDIEVNNGDSQQQQLSSSFCISPEKIYSENIGLITPHIAERIQHVLTDGVEAELLNKYILVAVERDKRNWSYIEKMALGNLEKNIKTVEQYKAHCLEWEKKNNKNTGNKKPTYANFEQREYKEDIFEKHYANLKS